MNVTDVCRQILLVEHVVIEGNIQSKGSFRYEVDNVINQCFCGNDPEDNWVQFKLVDMGRSVFFNDILKVFLGEPI